MERYLNLTSAFGNSPAPLMCASLLFVTAAALGRRRRDWAWTAALGGVAVAGLGIAGRRAPAVIETACDTALAGTFYAALPAAAAVVRALGYDPLQRRSAPRDSYWIPRYYTKQTREQFERAS